MFYQLPRLSQDGSLFLKGGTANFTGIFFVHMHRIWLEKIVKKNTAKLVDS